MPAPPRTYALHEIAQAVGALRRMSASCSNAYWSSRLADAVAIVEQLAALGADAQTVLVDVRRWFSEEDTDAGGGATCLLPEAIDVEARRVISAARGLRTLAGSRARSDRAAHERRKAR